MPWGLDTLGRHYSRTRSGLSCRLEGVHTEGGAWEQSPMGQQSCTKERENKDNAMFQKPDKDCLEGKEDNCYVMSRIGQMT